MKSHKIAVCEACLIVQPFTVEVKSLWIWIRGSSHDTSFQLLPLSCWVLSLPWRDHWLGTTGQSKSFCLWSCLIWAHASPILVNYIRSYWWGNTRNMQTRCDTRQSNSFIWRVILCFATVSLVTTPQWNKSLHRQRIMQSKIEWFSVFIIQIGNALIALFVRAITDLKAFLCLHDYFKSPF